MQAQQAQRTALNDALDALAARLDARLRELSDEVAHYPTPIARCDEQLTKLIEQRAECLARLRALRAIAEGNDLARLDATRALLARYPLPEDADEAALVSTLRAAASTDCAR